MTETAVESEAVDQPAETTSNTTTDEQLIGMLVDRARSEGLQLTVMATSRADRREHQHRCHHPQCGVCRPEPGSHHEQDR
jgi:hypothetical protein